MSFNLARQNDEGNNNTNIGWKYAIFIDGKIITEKFVSKVNAKSGGITSQKYGVKKDQKIYIRIENSGDIKADVNYKLTVKHTASSVWENGA